MFTESEMLMFDGSDVYAVLPFLILFMSVYLEVCFFPYLVVFFFLPNKKKSVVGSYT
jgi:hypothetical protein